MSMEHPTPQERLAEAPFDDPRADIILQSSDGLQFHVFKIILTLASSVFADMFSIPLPASSRPHDKEVVSLSERSEDLELSLRHLYPVPPPETVPLTNVAVLAEFAQKYQVDALEKPITQYLRDNVELDPVGVYAIAVTYGYKDVGTAAARSCLNLPFSRLKSLHEQYATAQHISELFSYHVACGEAASEVASGRTWLSSFLQDGYFVSTGGGSRYRCSSCCTLDFINLDQNSESYGKRYGPRWLWKYLHRSALILASHPTAEAVTMEDFVLRANDCPSCKQDARQYMLDISERFGGEITTRVEWVPLPDVLTPSATTPQLPDTFFTDFDD
ncbi:hypothetical protein F5148DRAFT_943135 [Russula earlei]|uniref:Uncharacterized protein n=1 Tax=Russula earlei TaxID=71964 RepID=A0ACC0U9B0_9AGAM|nr:hypothetical protein F5148DRAFT_943135 [Russula earlei]